MPVARKRRPEPTLTFLQYVAGRLLGPPSRAGGAYGESYWVCPLHADDTPSFHTLPARDGCGEYWKCFGCNRHGDVWQLMRELRAIGHRECQGRYNPDHQAKVAVWEAEWNLNASTEGKDPPAPTPAETFPSVEALRLTDPLTAGLGGSADPYDIEEAYRNATERQRQALTMAFVLARTAGVDLVALCRYAWHQEMEYTRWIRDLDKCCLEAIAEETLRCR